MSLIRALKTRRPHAGRGGKCYAQEGVESEPAGSVYGVHRAAEAAVLAGGKARALSPVAWPQEAGGGWAPFAWIAIVRYGGVTGSLVLIASFQR